MITLLLLSALGFQAHATPTASPTPLALDHVVIAVKDLEFAKAHFSALGFRLKPGRLHANNLLNHHIKFRNGSGLELMTLAGPPRDRMAEELRALIVSHDGGAYVALRTSDVNAIARSASALGLSPRRSTSGTWRFLSFPPSSAAGALFFVSGGERPEDPDAVTRHADGSSQVREAWLEAGAKLGRLLVALGARSTGPTSGPGARTGTRYTLGSTSLVLVAPAFPRESPRVLGAVLEAPTSAEATRPVMFPIPSFWIAYN